MFDPNEYKPGDSPVTEFVDSAGEYLCVMKKLKGRGSSKNGNPYVDFIAEVIGGKPENQHGRRFSQRMFHSPNALARFGAMCHSMQQVESFDLADDVATARALLFKPFKAKVIMEEGGDGNGYAGVKFFQQGMTQVETEHCNAWVDTHMDYIETMLEKLDWSGDKAEGDDIPF